jgi:hypothetical protein
MSALHEEEREKEKAIRETTAILGDAVQSLEKHKALVAERMKALYKKGRMAEWEALASMKSVNQALVWIKYQKMILGNDRRNLRVLARKEKDVSDRKAGLERDLSEKQKLIEEGRSQTMPRTEQTERKHLLAAVRKEKETVDGSLAAENSLHQEIEI